MINAESSSPRFPSNDATSEPESIYREHEMKALLTPQEWETYRALKSETQVHVAYLVINGKTFVDAIRFVVWIDG